MPVPAGEWTVAKLESLPDDGNRYEIIDGDLFVTPAPSYAHQRIVREIGFRLHGYLAGSSTAEVILSPAAVVAGERTSVEPDVFVVRLVDGQPIAGPAALRDVLLAIEVLSPSTASLDRYRKRRKYQREGVAEYWIVDPDARFVERWLPHAAEPEIVRERLTWQAPGATTALELELGSFLL